MSGRLAVLAAAWWLTAAGVAHAQVSQTPPPATDERFGLWIAAGAGGVLARGHCGTCDLQGVFFYSPGVIVDAGFQVNRRVDAGIEVAFVSSKIEDLDPIRTTFVLGVGQFRPWRDRGLSLRGGMGIGFVGNAIYSFAQPNPPLPFTTNAVALVLGIGWEFLREDRFTLQLLATQHVVALGELTTVTGTLKNIVGNYWMTSAVLVIR